MCIRDRIRCEVRRRLKSAASACNMHFIVSTARTVSHEAYLVSLTRRLPLEAYVRWLERSTTWRRRQENNKETYDSSTIQLKSPHHLISCHSIVRVRATGLGQTEQAPRFNGRLPGKNFDYTPCIESHLIYSYHSPSSSVPDQRFLCQVCHW